MIIDNPTVGKPDLERTEKQFFERFRNMTLNIKEK